VRHTISIALAFLMLAACAEMPLPEDAVGDASAAIRIAKAACIDNSPWWTRRLAEKLDWQAKFHDRVWSVWLEGLERGCHDIDVQINAADGKPSACTECVIVT
jgi:hypothetical protein